MRFKCPKCSNSAFYIHNDGSSTFSGEITSLELQDQENFRNMWYASCIKCKKEWGPVSTLSKLEGLMVREGSLNDNDRRE